jgi:hypothetical protein
MASAWRIRVRTDTFQIKFFPLFRVSSQNRGFSRGFEQQTARRLPVLPNEPILIIMIGSGRRK